MIADAKELLLNGKALLIGGRPIDLVYNRLVDFALEEPRHAVLQAAYLGGRRCFKKRHRDTRLGGYCLLWIPPEEIMWMSISFAVKKGPDASVYVFCKSNANA